MEERHLLLLLSLRTLGECHLSRIQREREKSPVALVHGDFQESLEQLTWCQETFKRLLPDEQYAKFFEVYWQREEAGWSFAEIAQYWKIQEPSARALVQKARRHFSSQV